MDQLPRPGTEPSSGLSPSRAVVSWRRHAGPPEAAPSSCAAGTGHRLLRLAALGAVREASHNSLQSPMELGGTFSESQSPSFKP